MRRPWAALWLLSVACAPTPDYYKVPPQHRSAEIAAIAGYKEFVRVDELDADAHFVKDVQGLEGGFRWTHAEPVFRFSVHSVEKRRLRLEFSVHDVTFRETGPVAVVVSVNGNELARVRYGEPGRKTFEKAVPSGWLKTGSENVVSMRVLNPYQAGDGVQLGVILYAAGFVGP